MMINSVRPSRRSTVLLVAAVIFLFIAMFAFKDMNDKLNVMTASNAGYQRMTDTQSEKIRKLNAQIEDLQESHKLEQKSSLEAEQKLKKEVQQSRAQTLRLQEDKDSLKKEFDTLSKTHMQITEQLNQVEENLAEVSRIRSELEKDKAVIRDQMNKIMVERDSCKRQYLALFKQHQHSSDALGELHNQKEQLQIRLQDITSQQILFQTSSTHKDFSPLQPNLRQPDLKQISSSSSSSTTSGSADDDNDGGGGGGGGGGRQPVGVPPPAPLAAHQPPEVVPHMMLAKEDVMEAPQASNSQDYDHRELNPHLPLELPKRQALHQQGDHVLRPPPHPADTFVRPRHLPYLQQQQHQQQQPAQRVQMFPYPQAAPAPPIQGRQIPKVNRFSNVGDNLDQQVDHIQQEHPDLLQHHGEDEYDGDDAADGQLAHQGHQPQEQPDFDNDVDFDNDNSVRETNFGETGQRGNVYVAGFRRPDKPVKLNPVGLPADVRLPMKYGHPPYRDF